MKRVIQSKTRTKLGATLVLLALVLALALGITCPSSAFALDKAGTDALSGASVAQEQTTDTLQDTKAASNDALEEAETPSSATVEPGSSNLDTATPVDKGGQEATSKPSSDPEDASIAPTQTAELPALTGYVFISGSTKVGATLSATVEGAPRSAALSYQWYRGVDPISGATSTTYTTTNADDDCDISCRVSAAGYEGVLISGSIKPALPALTGSVVIVNVSSPDGIEVGDTLAAAVNGVQADALLHCQWYRGDTAIEGATSTNYVLVNTDVGQPIICRVTAENYRGVLVSNVLIPSDQLVTVEYWSYTDASQNDMVIVHTEVANLADRFNYRFDQNKDDDPSNDYVGYRCSGWMDEWGLEFYDINAPLGEYTTTLGDIANMLEWDGMSPLRMYAYMDLRYIEVIYEAGVYEEKVKFDKVQSIPWNLSPYLPNLYLPGYKMLCQIDEYGDELDASMTCGYILKELLDDPWADTLYIYIDWLSIEYQVSYIFPNGVTSSVGMRYEDEIHLPSDGLGFVYPGHEFVGWFTEPDGAGIQVLPGTIYRTIEANDKVTERNLYAYFTPKTYRLTIDLGAGRWIDGATESRPEAFPAAPGQSSYTIDWKVDQSIVVPIDTYYGGLVSAGPDASGRTYRLAGYAIYNGDDATAISVLLPNGETECFSYPEAIAGANQLNGPLNNAIYQGLANSGHIYFPAIDPTAFFKMWGSDITLYAIWCLTSESLTFIPEGYADINDPDFDPTYRSLYQVYVHPNGGIDKGSTNAEAKGSWNTPDGVLPDEIRDHALGTLEEGDVCSIVLPRGSLLKRTGYTFAGWATTIGATQPDSEFVYIDLDSDGIPDAPNGGIVSTTARIFYAVWKANEIDVVFDVNLAGAAELPSATWLVDCVYVLPNWAPAADRYSFIGWAKSPDASEPEYSFSQEYQMLPLVEFVQPDDVGNQVVTYVNPNIFYGVWAPIQYELQYLGLKDTSEEDYTVVHTKQVFLTDVFDSTFDQNKDDDPNNDLKGFNTASWWDGTFACPIEDGMTIQEVAELGEWDGTGPIIVYAEYGQRSIKVTYEHRGAEGAEAKNSAVVLYWFTPVLNNSYLWQGHRLVGIHDAKGNSIDNEMDCGYVLDELLDDPWAEELTIYYTWEKIDYVVRYLYPNDMVTVQHVEFATRLDLPTADDVFDYPGYEFVGWFTEPDGAGTQAVANVTYAILQKGNDQLEELVLYAYFKPIDVSIPLCYKILGG